ncbi:MAG TPA: hypothetical protein GX528_03040 [Firmicutes bacterium]|nr:hypothetical protein [Bacillota bacterium]
MKKALIGLLVAIIVFGAGLTTFAHFVGGEQEVILSLSKYAEIIVEGPLTYEVDVALAASGQNQDTPDAGLILRTNTNVKIHFKSSGNAFAAENDYLYKFVEYITPVGEVGNSFQSRGWHSKNYSWKDHPIEIPFKARFRKNTTYPHEGERWSFADHFFKFKADDYHDVITLTVSAN